MRFARIRGMRPTKQIPEPELLRVDLHSHTWHSPDGATSPEELVERARRVGLDWIAVTDHGTIEGALEAREIASGLVIVGEEIRCLCRTEVIGLFLSERIPSRLPIEEVVERIHDQGGVVYAPHPFAYPWRAAAHAWRALGVADVVEAFNARAFLPVWNRTARRAAERRGLPTGAGSDAHFPQEIGRAYTVMPAFDSALEFRRAAREARPVGLTTTGPVYHLASRGLKLARATARRARPGQAPRTPASVATPSVSLGRRFRGGPAIG